MALKGMLFISLFALVCVGALVSPICGVLGYVGHYSIGPERQWWHVPFSRLGIRYSFTLALLTAIGIAVNWRKMRFGKSILTGHERLILLFLGIIWLSAMVGAGTVGKYTIIDHPSVKMTNVVIFTLMLSHVVTNLRDIDRLLWVLVIGALILGLQAYDTPRSAFQAGRLERVGGSDFRESNVLAAYLISMLPIIAVQFLRSKWPGKLLCLAAGAFAANAIVLTRSRGAVLGFAASGLLAALLAPKRLRRKVFAGLIVAFLGGLYLADAGFIRRASTINNPEDSRDASAQSRLELWQGGGRMMLANPLGVGVGNFYQYIGAYAPGHGNRDAHNTFVRCGGELGLPGLIAFSFLLASAFRKLRSLRRQGTDLPPLIQDHVAQLAYGLTVSLVGLVACGMTITLIYNEHLWWFLVLPVCLIRAVENISAKEARETSPLELEDRAARKPRAFRRPGFARTRRTAP